MNQKVCLGIDLQQWPSVKRNQTIHDRDFGATCFNWDVALKSETLLGQDSLTPMTTISLIISHGYLCHQITSWVWWSPQQQWFIIWEPLPSTFSVKVHREIHCIKPTMLRLGPGVSWTGPGDWNPPEPKGPSARNSTICRSFPRKNRGFLQLCKRMQTHANQRVLPQWWRVRVQKVLGTGRLTGCHDA